MRIVVTGAAGFIGSHVAERLVADGHSVVGVDAFVDYYAREIKERNVRSLRDSPGFELVELDLRDGDLRAVVEGADAVINEAAMPGLPRSWVDVELYASCNLLAVDRLVRACREAGVPRLLHVSTSSVYGDMALGDEEGPLRPMSPYGITKLAAEQLLLAQHALFGLPAVIVRYFSIYGPRQRPDMAYNIFIEALLHDREITVFGDGEQSRSSTFITDCVEGTLRALELGRPGQIYNIGGGEVVTVREAIGIIADELGVEPRIVYAPARPGDQRHTKADTSKAASELGYRPTVAPEEGLRRQVSWQRGEGIRPPRP
jgi:UDP-glucuronate 4-epimerase